MAKCRGRTIRDYLIWNPLLPQVEHLTVTKMYVIIIPKRSGIYNIPIIPVVLTSTIFEKGKQEVNYCQDRYAHSGLYILLFYCDVNDILRVDVPNARRSKVRGKTDECYLQKQSPTSLLSIERDYARKSAIR